MIYKNLNFALVNNINSHSSLKAFPDPSNDEMIIEIDEIDCKNCWVIISDLTGSSLKQFQIFNSLDKITLNKKDFSNGIFQCSLIDNGIVLNSIKIAFLQ